jgi:hypothetical protein
MEAAPVEGRTEAILEPDRNGKWRLISRHDRETKTAADIDLIDCH